jgi:hypothetical protein
MLKHSSLGESEQEQKNNDAASISNKWTSIVVHNACWMRCRISFQKHPDGSPMNCVLNEQSRSQGTEFQRPWDLEDLAAAPTQIGTDSSVACVKGMRIILWLILLLIAQSLQSVTATDCVIAPFQQQSKLNATHYGSFKAGLFSYLSLDNRVRYCKRFGLACIIVSAEQAVETSAELAKQAPRVSKLQHILAVLDEPKDCSRLVYLDSDIVITTSSQNIFNSDFFRAAAAGQPIALTHDLVWTNATDVPAQPSTRYQTGVMLMQRSPLLVELLQAWLGQRKTERFDGSLARLRATGSSDKQQPTAQVSDSDPWDSDQWLLDRLLKAQPAYAAAISPLQPRHVYNAFPVHRALQHANATTLHQSRREKEGVAAALWQQMRRPQGDEVPGESLLVHFAGGRGQCSSLHAAVSYRSVFLLSQVRLAARTQRLARRTLCPHCWRCGVTWPGICTWWSSSWSRRRHKHRLRGSRGSRRRVIYWPVMRRIQEASRELVLVAMCATHWWPRRTSRLRGCYGAF